MTTDASLEVGEVIAVKPAAELPRPQTAANHDGDEDVQSLLASKIASLEGQISSAEPRTREIAKRHKKSLREVQKLVSDTSKTPQEVVAALQLRTMAAINDAWKLEKQLPELEVKVEKLQRQSKVDQDTIEKGILMRTKLQDLCRELQKQAKEAQLESRQSQEEEKTKRQAMLDNVNSTVASITERLDQQAETVSKQAQENALLKEQLQRMLDTLQISEAHGKQQAELLKKLEERGDAYAQRYEASTKENALLAEQVAEYNARFQEFQGTLTKSNEMFALLKSDAKAARVRERELLQKSEQLRQQYEKTGMLLLRTSEESAAQKDTIAKLTLANERLQSLCRALQAPKAVATDAPAADAAAPAASPSSEGDAVGSAQAEAEQPAALQDQSAAVEGLAAPNMCPQEPLELSDTAASSN